MRMLGVADMPPSMETGRCELLLACLGKALTDKRYHIKFQVPSGYISIFRASDINILAFYEPNWKKSGYRDAYAFLH